MASGRGVELVHYSSIITHSAKLSQGSWTQRITSCGKPAIICNNSKWEKEFIDGTWPCPPEVLDLLQQNEE